MKKYGSRVVILLALLLILSSLFSLTAFASGSDSDAGVTQQAESESDALIPQTEGADLSAPAFAAPQIPETAEPVTRPESSREPVTPDPPISYPPPDTHEIPEDEDDSGFIESVLNFFEGVKNFFVNFVESIGDGLIGGFVRFIEDALDIGSGRWGLMDLLEDGGARYVSDRLNNLINALYGVFYAPGIVVMIICFCFGVFKGCYSMELGDKNSIIKPIIGLIIALFAFTLAKNIMTAFFQIAMQLSASVVKVVKDAGVVAWSSSGSSLTDLGFGIVTTILRLILMINIAKIALLQSTSPLYLGFAAAENTRRVLINFAKEYAKCCLIPPITAAYASIVMCIGNSTWSLFGGIVLGISIWSIGRKFQEKIFS